MRPSKEESPRFSELRALARLRDDIQKLRIGERNRSDSTSVQIHEDYGDELQVLEDTITRDLGKLVTAHPAAAFVTGIHGCGATIAARILADMDIAKASTVSALWKFAGYGVTDGKADRRTKGQKLCYNKSLKTSMWVWLGSQIKLRGPYELIYRDARHRYETTRQVGENPWTKAHCHVAAGRVAIKLFLSHLWEHWRKLEGLPTPDPYILQQQGHDKIEFDALMARWRESRDKGAKDVA